MNTITEVFNVVIIGAGQIGAFYDQPDSENVLTHAHAFSNHSGFKLLGFLDKDPIQADRAVSVWGGKSFSDFNQLQLEQINVVCLAVPDEYHYIYLKELINWDISFIFTEKPLVQTLEQAEEIKQLYTRSSPTIQLNYSRRFIPEIIKLRENIQQGRYGRFMTGTGYYGKGLLHNGSHMIDLLRNLLGEIQISIVLDYFYDFYQDDPTVDVILELEQGGKFYMQGVDCNAFTMFEIDLVFEHRRIRITDTGFRIVDYKVKDNRIFNGYRNIVKTQEFETSLGSSLYYAVDNIYKHLTEGETLRCGLEDGYKAVSLCQKIRAGLKV